MYFPRSIVLDIEHERGVKRQANDSALLTKLSDENSGLRDKMQVLLQDYQELEAKQEKSAKEAEDALARAQDNDKRVEALEREVAVLRKRLGRRQGANDGESGAGDGT